jgi:uncharacterized membrane protein YdfJ with MMPL/SSD domain
MMRLSSSLRRYRWAVFIVWLLVLVPAVLVSLHESNNLTGGGFEVAGSQSLRVQRQLEIHYPDQGASPLALVAAPRAGATAEDMIAAVDLLNKKAAELPSVSVPPNTAQPPPRPDRPYVIPLKLAFNNSGAVDIAKKLRSKVGIHGDQPGQIDNGRVDLYVIGQGALGAAAQANTKHDIAEAEQWNLPIILIVLLAVFGSLAAAAMPLILGVLTVAISMGLVFALSTHITMSVFVTPTVSMFGIALAVDYSLFILMRYREELRAGRDSKQATDAAMATSGLAVVLSGMTVIASVTGIYLINTPVLRSMATGAVLTVAVAVLTSVTLIPPVLATFGRAAAKRSRLLHLSRRPETTQSPFWTRWISWVMRRPWASALGASLLLLTLAVPALAMTLSNSMQRQFPPTHEIRGGVSAAAQALGPGALGPIRVLVAFPDGPSETHASSPEHKQLIDALDARMREAPNIVTVQPPIFADDNKSVLLSAVLSVDPEDMSARDTINWMRRQLPQVPGAQNAGIDVGGPTALIADFDDQVQQTQPWVFVFVSVIAFVMLLISIRSVFLAFKGVLMTVLSVATAYGSIVMVFQWGWLKDLGFQPISSLDSSVPPLVLAITFGLSMDYEIFLLTRIRERFLQTNNTRDAVSWGVSTSARTITSAALIMIAVYVGFAFAGMPLVAEIGVACAVAIAVDATVVRLVLVPALMAMFDQWNWWLPRWLARILPSVDFERPLPKVDIGDVVLIPEDISALVAPSADVRMVVKSAAKLKGLAPNAITVADPLAFSGCGRRDEELADRPMLSHRNGHNATGSSLRPHGSSLLRNNGGGRKNMPWAGRGVHPVTMWRGRLSVALDALEVDAHAAAPPVERRSPVETTSVQLPTGDRLQIPTGAETLRLKGYLLMCRNSCRDYAEFAELVDTMDAHIAGLVLAGMDKYYCGQQPRKQWVATQLVRRLADPRPWDDEVDPDVDWVKVKERCLSVAVAMLEEAR